MVRESACAISSSRREDRKPTLYLIRANGAYERKLEAEAFLYKIYINI